MRGVYRVAAVAAIVPLLLVAGCAAVPADSRTDSYVDPYTGTALQYGAAPESGAGTTFQPDVVLVGGGGDAVRDVSADGLRWTVDADAPGASELTVGSVMFVTGRGVGRVAELERADGALSATLAPVALTDVIRDGSYASDGPVSLENPIVQAAPEAFWGDASQTEAAGVGPAASMHGDAGSAASVSPAVVPALALQPAAAPPAAPSLPPAEAAQEKTVQNGNFSVTATCCSTGIGAHLAYDRNGLRIAGDIGLRMSKPSAKFTLDISGGTLRQAAFELKGAGGIHAELTAATAPGSPANGHSPPLAVNLGFTVPVGTLLGIPFSATVTQMLSVNVNIPGSASVTVVGDFTLSGGLGFGYRDGSFTNTSGAGFDASTSLDGSNSLAVGVSTVTIDHQAKFGIGIGFLGFGADVHALVVSHLYSRDRGAGRLQPPRRSERADRTVQVGAVRRVPDLRRRLFDPRARRQDRQLLPEGVQDEADPGQRRTRGLQRTDLRNPLSPRYTALPLTHRRH